MLPLQVVLGCTVAYYGAIAHIAEQHITSIAAHPEEP